MSVGAAPGLKSPYVGSSFKTVLLNGRDADPIFDHTSVVLLDTKLNKEEVPRPELDLADSSCTPEVGLLTSKLSKDRISMLERQYLDGRVLERAGLPRLCLFYLDDHLGRAA